MPGLVAAVLVLAYVSLAIELLVLRVPSVASSYAIWRAIPDVAEAYSARYRRLFALGPPLKAALLVLPLAVVYGVFAYPIIVLAAGPDPLGDYVFAPSAVSYGAGAAAVTAGRGAALAAAFTLLRAKAHEGTSFRLHTTGLFRWSRNPGLVGMYFFAGGSWLAMPSATLLAGIAVYVAHMHFKVRMEEDFLSHKFGAEYAVYRLRTGRYLP